MNRLYPIFAKLEKLEILLVGGGNVALEKIASILNNCPESPVNIVAEQVLPDIWNLQASYPNIRIDQRRFQMEDIQDKDIIFLATNDYLLHEKIYKEARKRKILVNVADTPSLCDFYLGSIVQKGDLKIAISTNGKSPTIAKRVREFLNDLFPEEIHQLLGRMNEVRNSIKGDFREKVMTLNKLTSEWLIKHKT